MKSKFFSRRIRLFGSVAVLILCIVFFLIPFEFRGARMSLGRIKNDVKDWLPSDFPETKDLDWFRDNFLGEQFVLATWPGCSEDDPRLEFFVERLRAEIAPDKQPPQLSPEELADLPQRLRDQHAAELERYRAGLKADELGLHKVTQNYDLNWGGRKEKWLQGNDKLWYFITPDGKLYRWNGRSNVLGYATRKVSRMMGQRSAEGEHIDTFGAKYATDKPNEFYTDPRKISARFFNSVVTGPEVIAQLTEIDGAFQKRVGNDKKAKQLAYERLTGSLFGPTLPEGFQWTSEEIKVFVGTHKIGSLPSDWHAQFDGYVQKLVASQYEGKIQNLIDAPVEQGEAYWNAFFPLLINPETGKQVDPKTNEPYLPPARQTCMLVTISGVGHADLSSAIGREVMGKPLGRLRDIALNECGAISDMRLGGPPVDNVSIDEEGSITLQRLVLWCALIGLGLAYLCFRSFKVTFMVFFVGCVSAVTSLGIVWWTGSAVDTILLSMPALIYVLGLSGAIHIVNYYRDAVETDGEEGAAETALSHGWFPCTLAAFTTSLGLVSLCTSRLVPIWKFGFFSAIGTMATLILLFTYLPSALHVWSPGYRRRSPEQKTPRKKDGLMQWVSLFWERVGTWVIRRNALVTTVALVVLTIFGWGLLKIETSVQLLKLFHKDANIIQDYRWMEGNLGKLIPMELVVRAAPNMMRPLERKEQPKVDSAKVALLKSAAGDEQSNNQLRAEHVFTALFHRKPTDEEIQFGQQYLGENPSADRCEEYVDLMWIRPQQLELDMLARLEIIARVQQVVEETFGDAGRQIVGRGMSAVTFTPPMPAAGGSSWGERKPFNDSLIKSRQQLLESDYLRIDKQDQSELWRISLRLGALNDVDYGDFVNDLSQAVEPVLTAYRFRKQIYQQVEDARELGQLKDSDNYDIVILGSSKSDNAKSGNIDQTKIFVETLAPLFINDRFNVRQVSIGEKTSEESLIKSVDKAACVLVLDSNPAYSLEMLGQHASLVVDASDHHFQPNADRTNLADKRGEDLAVVYTGVVPIIYKAQRTLLTSLINSIGWAFVTIAAVMMILLRDWKSPPSLGNIVNTRAGFVSMIPNIFPVIIIFGAMGHLRVSVDIGTMMTASVAMGIAVDDTIHFLSWFRHGMRIGLVRKDAIMLAYKRVATAMTQTTIIGGMGLAVFAFSTFTPTQRFGVMMLVLLLAALVGDLILLPALLAGPLGKFFEVSKNKEKTADTDGQELSQDQETSAGTPRTMTKPREHQTTSSAGIRTDAGHS